MEKIHFLDCTLRDGGYYNAWDFSQDLVNDYLSAIGATGVDIVEMGLRSLNNNCYAGAFAYTTDDYLRNLPLPKDVAVCVMVNASDLLGDTPLESCMEKLFPESASTSPVKLVRVACHIHEFSRALPASVWLKERGYSVGFNLMQIADRSQQEIESLAAEAAKWPLDVLYFADSMGSMSPKHTIQIISWLRTCWKGALGIHTHDNMGKALQNTLCAIENGVTWVDATVTGMGRGPGNARTEELSIELAEVRGTKIDLISLLGVIRRYFAPLKRLYGWGTNPYYYLAGKYGIHPTYIQEMISDSRYDEEDVLAVIERLSIDGGKKFNVDTLDAARQFYQGPPRGTWDPKTVLEGREVLLLGGGPSVSMHREAIEHYVKKYKPFVVALNTQLQIGSEFIDACIASHPTRLVADCALHVKISQPLITPYSMLPLDVRLSLRDKEVLDFGLSVKRDTFVFGQTYCITPASLVVAYALAVATSGFASRILFAGFDGYNAADLRNAEMDRLIKTYQSTSNHVSLYSITPTRFLLSSKSVYGLL